ncbi:uncharacterized protein MYCFIDRAFT_180681 [Pseudocercospora fijiensis CIRAD86]|uniref:Uncharacterized protein n=1 Tax=Pseudocercospora fijiensis (strain CIRAD86) TaxID=383855 RepID=M2ZCG4_PSEFD|nr:uncharacterized protein MYCFIDRAFT_180681 [Pseudocercospora fijiensis CIRAD86]EME76779.1 hypothetical protein MYCFIDRAFT_180681 [Pseudocercospora fijiensis CIRAD86]
MPSINPIRNNQCIPSLYLWFWQPRPDRNVFLCPERSIWPLHQTKSQRGDLHCESGTKACFKEILDLMTDVAIDRLHIDDLYAMSHLSSTQVIVAAAGSRLGIPSRCFRQYLQQDTHISGGKDMFNLGREEIVFGAQPLQESQVRSAVSVELRKAAHKAQVRIDLTIFGNDMGALFLPISTLIVSDELSLLSSRYRSSSSSYFGNSIAILRGVGPMLNGGSERNDPFYPHQHLPFIMSPSVFAFARDPLIHNANAAILN